MQKENRRGDRPAAWIHDAEYQRSLGGVIHDHVLEAGSLQKLAILLGLDDMIARLDDYSSNAGDAGVLPRA